MNDQGFLDKWVFQSPCYKGSSHLLQVSLGWGGQWGSILQWSWIPNSGSQLGAFWDRRTCGMWSVTPYVFFPALSLGHLLSSSSWIWTRQVSPGFCASLGREVIKLTSPSPHPLFPARSSWHKKHKQTLLTALNLEGSLFKYLPLHNWNSCFNEIPTVIILPWLSRVTTKQ